jgi:serine/threonine protein kinase
MSETQQNIDDFVLLTIIGKGSYGKIILVKEIKSEKVFAMKVLKKKLLSKHNKINTVFTERNLLI